MAQHLSREEFRQWAQGQKRRYERIAGEPVAMSPKRIEHVRIKNPRMGRARSVHTRRKLAL